MRVVWALALFVVVAVVDIDVVVTLEEKWTSRTFVWGSYQKDTPLSGIATKRTHLCLG